MSQITLIANWFLRLPLLWGGLATLAFYALIRVESFSSQVVTRYFDSHYVEYVSTLLFFVGAAALAIRLAGLLGQFGVLGSNPLGAKPAGGQPTTDAELLLNKLDNLPEPAKRTHFINRLRSALEYVRETDSADALEEHLARLEDIDRERVHASYALPRLVRATLPIVGMLGTVIGITLAIGQLSPEALEESLNEVMGALSVAFDTTAQAMSLMLLLWFVTFGVESLEERLLDRVDRASGRLLIGRFQIYGAKTDPSVMAVRRMSEQVVETVEHMTAAQAETWQTAIDATHQRWSESTASAGDLLSSSLKQGVAQGLADHADRLNQAVSDQISQLKQAEAEHSEQLTSKTSEMLGNLGEGLERMAELLVEALRRHGETLTEAEQELATENRRHLAEVEAALGESMVVSADRQEKLIRQSESLLGDMQSALVSTSDATVKHQEQLVKQGEVLLRVVESTGQLQRLEESLNRNLSSLSKSHHFEETLVSLSAAIQLLSARLGKDAPTASDRNPGQAA